MMKAAEVEKWRKYFEKRNEGIGVAASAKHARISESTAWRFERNEPTNGGLEAASILGIYIVAGNMVAKPLSDEARKALEDFSYFRLRYFGRKSTPWQVRAAEELMAALSTEQIEYIVMNEPPGSGKSTLFTHDIPCWIIANNRAIRMQIGSATERMARTYVGRIKRTLERDAPLRASSDALARGIAFDAEACMQDDFGAFKPEGRGELWRAEALVVRQLDGVQADDKEPTVSAWGQDSKFLGGRFDVVIWDDLVDRGNNRTPEKKEQLREWWDGDAESRVEPGGLLLLQGQRIAHDDLYRYCLDKRTMDEKRLFRHVMFKAHDESKCTGNHDNLKAWPESCLLDPHRLPWKHLETKKYNNPRAYEIMYQQQDGDVVGGLIDHVWITGGLDEDGYAAPGCLDVQRDILEPPVHLLDGVGWSHITVDPSPTEWWGIIWWLYDPDSERKYIIDLHRKRLNPEQFLSLDLDTMTFSGLLHDMYLQAQLLSIPFTHVVVEVNAAQRWLLSQPHVQRWSAMTGVIFVPHTTTVNKADPKYGLESIGDNFRQGLIRIPWLSVGARQKMQRLIDEGERYPDHETTDLIMSTWFSKLAIQNHYAPRQSGQYRQARPKWLAGSQRGIA